MRLYTRTGATALDHPEHGHFDADENGAFDFPDEVSDGLHSFHAGGKPMWETDVERQHRLMQEELERRKDPATLLDAVEQIMRAAQVASAPAEPAAPKRTPKRTSTASKKTDPKS